MVYTMHVRNKAGQTVERVEERTHTERKGVVYHLPALIEKRDVLNLLILEVAAVLDEEKENPEEGGL